MREIHEIWSKILQYGTKKKWLAATFLAISAFFLAQYSTRNLIILNDARELYASDSYFGMNSMDAVRFFLLPHDYSRLFSAGTGQLIGNLCGPNSECINLINSFLLSLISVAAFCCTLLITKNLKVTFLTVSSWILSAATLNSILWQATQHDKLAALLFFITVSLAILMFRSSLDSKLKKISSGFFLTLFLAISFNTKETTFILPFVIFIVGMVCGLQNRQRIRDILIVLSLPIAYSAWYVLYFLTHISAGIASHSFSGSIWSTSVNFLRQFLHLGNFMYLSEYSKLNLSLIKTAAVLYLIGFTVVLFFLLRTIKQINIEIPKKFMTNPNSRLIFVPLLTLILSLGGVLRTEVPTVFYLLIPTWASLLLFWQFYVLVLKSKFGGKYLFQASVILIGLAYLSTYSIHFGQNGVVTKLNSSSETLKDTFNVMNELQVSERMTVALENPNSYGIWYLLYGATANADRWLSPYVFPGKEPLVEVSLIPDKNSCQYVKVGACVVLNSNYELVEYSR